MRTLLLSAALLVGSSVAAFAETIEIQMLMKTKPVRKWCLAKS